MKISLTNSKNQTVDLTADEKIYQVTSVSGLDPVEGQIFMVTIAGVDGSSYSGARVNNRNIVINFQINGDADTNRQNLFQKFPVKENVTVTVTTSRTATIEGYIESFSCDFFAKAQTAQISIICPNPYFRGERIAVSGIGSTHLIFGGNNPGDVPAEFSMDFDFQGDVSGLTIEDNLDNVLQFDFDTFTNPEFVINTSAKTATLMDGVSTFIDLIPSMQIGSTFPKARRGSFAISATPIGLNIGNAHGYLYFWPLYGGM